MSSVKSVVNPLRGYYLRMNWLAHLYLSEPTPAFRIGNLLPDLAAAPVLSRCPCREMVRTRALAMV